MQCGHVARQLVEAGHEVVAVVRNPARAGDLKNLGVQIYQGDVTEKESMRRTGSLGGLLLLSYDLIVHS